MRLLNIFCRTRLQHWSIDARLVGILNGLDTCANVNKPYIRSFECLVVIMNVKMVFWKVLLYQWHYLLMVIHF